MQNRLKQIRKEKGYTQIFVQINTGIEQGLLSKYENGERVPTIDSIMKLANFYDVSIDYILCRTDIPGIKP